MDVLPALKEMTASITVHAIFSIYVLNAAVGNARTVVRIGVRNCATIMTL